MSVCIADTKEDDKGRVWLAAAEWGSLSVILSAWGYFMYAVLRPNDTDRFNLFGITYYKGSAFDQLCYNAIIYLNVFGLLNVTMMLLSKHSNKARAICGYNSVDSRQSFQMTVLTGIYFNVILSSSSGLGDHFASSPVSMAVTTVQAASFYFLAGQYMYSLFFRHVT